MHMNPTMTLTLLNGEEKECNIVAKWSDNSSNYIAYIDGSTTDGELDLFLSKYEMSGEEFKLIAIDNDEEWNRVNAYLDELFNEDGDYDA